MGAVRWTGRFRTSTESSTRVSATPICSRRCTTCWGMMARRRSRDSHRRSERRSDSTAPQCCDRSPKSRCSRCRWVTYFSRRKKTCNVALRMDGYLRDGSHTGIPIGVYRAGGTDATIFLDADFLVGPEAAHLNITGVSGLATKTSAVEWILASLFTHFPGEPRIDCGGVLQREGAGSLLSRSAGQAG